MLKHSKLKPTIYAESLPPAIFQPYIRRPERKDTQATTQAAERPLQGGDTAEESPDTC